MEKSSNSVCGKAQEPSLHGIGRGLSFVVEQQATRCSIQKKIYRIDEIVYVFSV